MVFIALKSQPCRQGRKREPYLLTWGIGMDQPSMAIPFVSFCQVEVDEGGGNFQIVSWSQVGCVRQAETGS